MLLTFVLTFEPLLNRLEIYRVIPEENGAHLRRLIKQISVPHYTELIAHVDTL